MEWGLRDSDSICPSHALEETDLLLVVFKIPSIKQNIKWIRYVRYAVCLYFCKNPIPLDGDSSTIRNLGQNDADRSKTGKSIQ